MLNLFERAQNDLSGLFELRRVLFGLLLLARGVQSQPDMISIAAVDKSPHRAQQLVQKETLKQLTDELELSRAAHANLLLSMRESRK